MSATASPARHVPPTGMSRASEAVARAHGLPGGGDAWASTLLGRGPAVLDAVLAHWVWGSVANAGRLSERHGLGPHAARALVAAVEEMDAHAPEVEIARVWSEMSGHTVRPPSPPRAAAVRAVPAPAPTARRPSSAVPATPAGIPVPAPRPEPLPAPRSSANDAGDGAWFEANPGRGHRLRPDIAGWSAVRLLDLDGAPLTVALAYPGHPREGGDGGEPEALDAFEEAAMAWFAAARPSRSPERDAHWFSQRPARRHRLRAPYTTEVAGRLPATWVTLVASHLGRVLCLTVDEAGLPQGERGDADLAALFRDRAAAIACSQVLQVLCDVEEPAPSASDMRAASRGRQRPAALLATHPAGVDLPADDADAEADEAAPSAEAEGDTPAGARQGRKTNNGGQAGLVESWEDRVVARAQANHWPCMRVDEAFDVVEDLLAANGSLPIRAYDVRVACRRHTEDGAAALATLKAYGLLAPSANGMVRVTDRARDGLGRDPASKRAALAEVAMGPAAFREILGLVGPSPTLDELRGIPAARDMPKAEAAVLHERFVSAMAFRAAVA